MTQFRLKFMVMLLPLCCFATMAHAQEVEPRLAELRNQFALKYMQPEAHFSLAKYYLERGDKAQAFFIIETARRYRFEESDFDTAFSRYFGDPMPEPPNDAKDAFEFGFNLVKDDKFDEAEKYLIKAASLSKSFYINAWVGRFYYKSKSDPTKALPYYFDSYFLYPHAYETEYIESRISKIITSDAEAAYQKLRAGGRSPSSLASDRNSVIVGMALEEMANDWKPEYLPIMLEAMSYDDDFVRWRAFETVKKKAGPALDQVLTSLLADKDLRKRGLAAYALIDQWKLKGFNTLKKMLSDPAELIRFDAISALAISRSTTGRKLLLQHRSSEPNSRLKSLIDGALKEDSPGL